MGNIINLIPLPKEVKIAFGVLGCCIIVLVLGYFAYKHINKHINAIRSIMNGPVERSTSTRSTSTRSTSSLGNTNIHDLMGMESRGGKKRRRRKK